jgi:hypothetical protein
VETSDIKY